MSKNRNEETARTIELHKALRAKNGSEANILSLFDQRISPNSKDTANGGVTAAHLVVLKFPKLSIIEALHLQGADFSIADDKGISPMDYCKRMLGNREGATKELSKKYPADVITKRFDELQKIFTFMSANVRSVSFEGEDVSSLLQDSSLSSKSSSVNSPEMRSPSPSPASEAPKANPVDKKKEKELLSTEYV